MTQNNTHKKFGMSLACNMAADCIRDNVAPVSVVLANLFFLQKDSTFPTALQKEFFKTPRNLSPLEVQKVRVVMEALRSPNNGVVNLLTKHVEADWAFKKAPPMQKPVAQNYAKKKPVSYQKQKPKVTAASPTVVIKKTKTS